GFRIAPVSPRTGSPPGRSAGFSDGGPGVPTADQKKALEVGGRVYLRQPTNRDGAKIVAANRLSRALHRGWVLPPTDAAAFARWMKRCRQPNVKCFLVCGRADGAILGALILSEIVRGVFQSAYLGYYAQQPYAGKGYMTEAMRLVLRHAFTTMRLHRVEANVQPENAASIAVVKRSGFRLEFDDYRRLAAPSPAGARAHCPRKRGRPLDRPLLPGLVL